MTHLLVKVVHRPALAPSAPWAPAPHFYFYPSPRDEIRPAPVRLAFIPRAPGSLTEKDVVLDWIRKFENFM